MPRALMLTGDAAEELDVMYPLYRVREAGWDLRRGGVVAPRRAARHPRLRPGLRRVHGEVRPQAAGRPRLRRGRGRAVPRADHPGRPRAGVHPRRPGRPPHHGVLLRQGPAGRHDLPRTAGSGGLRTAAGPQDRGVPAAHRRHGERGRDGRRRARRGRRQHGLLPRLAGHAGVVARVHGRARAHRRSPPDQHAPARRRPGPLRRRRRRLPRPRARARGRARRCSSCTARDPARPAGAPGGSWPRRSPRGTASSCPTRRASAARPSPEARPVP